MRRFSERWKRLAQLYHREIWQPSLLNDTTIRGRGYALLRVISITLTVFGETKAASRAAALSFSSLLGIGPVIAIAMLVAGFVLDQNDPRLAVNTLNKLFTFIAPQISEYEHLSAQGKVPPPAATRSDVVAAATLHTNAAVPPVTVEPPAPGTTPVPSDAITVNPEMVQLINGFIAGSRSGAAGVVGALTLIFIVLQLFTSVENSFNEIWGVRRGRTLLMRVVFYWTVLTLGAVLFFAAITMLGAGAFLNVFFEKLPFGDELLTALRWMLPSLSIALLVLILTIFYRCIPNTHVFWRSAFIGAVFVAVLLVLNNFLAFFYFRRVILSKSLYGSLGILPILMLGLYIFWLFVLVGGQISYAVQNVHFRNSQAAWARLSEAMRERLSLIVLLTISRRFRDCLPPVTASQLGDLVRVPTQILNECLNRLVDMKLLTPIPPPPGGAATDYLYQPARPLSRISLLEFKELDDNFGDDPVGDTLERIDPILQHYNTALSRLGDQEFFQKSLEQLFAENAFDISQPPFAMGERRKRA